MVTFFKKKCCWFLCIILSLPSLSVEAQKKYQLQELINAAKNHLPSLQQKQALINVAKANATDVKHSFYPQLKISDQINLGSDNSLAGSYLPIGITPSTSGGITSNNNNQAATGSIAALYSEYELFNFGLNHAKMQSANAYINLQEADWQKDFYYLQLEISRDYFQFIKIETRLKTDAENVNRYDSIFKVIKALTNAGIKPGSDSSLAKAELSKTKVVYNQSLGNWNQLKEKLSFLTGISFENLNIENEKCSSNTIQIFNQPADTINNPLIAFYKQKQNIFLSNEKVIRRSFMPKLILAGATWARGSSIQYNAKYESLETGLNYQRYNYEVGVALTYNLLNGLYMHDKLKANRYQMQAIEDELLQQELALNSSMKQADFALQTAQTNLKELEVQMNSAHENYQQNLARYQAGLISLIDLTNASYVWYRSQTDYIETWSDWYLAQLDKAAAAGTLTTFIQTIK